MKRARKVIIGLVVILLILLTVFFPALSSRIIVYDLENKGVLRAISGDCYKIAYQKINQYEESENNNYHITLWYNQYGVCWHVSVQDGTIEGKYRLVEY